MDSSTDGSTGPSTDLPDAPDTSVFNQSGADSSIHLPADLSDDLTAYVCGSPGFADAATELLTGAGIAPSHIRVERFGPTQ